MIEKGSSPSNLPKKPPVTAKTLIHQKFGDKASYTVEEVQVSTQNDCPGLAIQPKGPPLYRCTLNLPETVVISDICKKKKDAERSAAEKAVEKLGIVQKEYNPTLQEARDDLAGRLTFLFSSEFLSSEHPVSSHFRAALRRDGPYNGFVPVSAIAVYDAKIISICKHIVPEAESNSQLVMSLIVKAAADSTDLVPSSDEKLSLKRRNPYPSDVILSLTNPESNLSENIILVEVIRIPALLEKPAESLTISMEATGYYLDFIAHELGVMEASNVLITKTIGKSSSEMRIYFSAPNGLLLDNLLEPQVPQVNHREDSLNVRATYLAGQEVYGDAILASTGYSWRSITDLFCEDISLRTYYRLLMNKIPNGAYKLSREAILAAKLPLSVTTKSNWRGSSPRDILCSICRLHHLSEPIFLTKTKSDSSPDFPGSSKKLKVTKSGKESIEAFSSCEVKIFSKSKDLILHCSPQESYRKQVDAVQSAALKVLSWLRTFLENPNTPLEELELFAKKLNIHVMPRLYKEFALCLSVRKCSTPLSEAEDELAFIDIGGSKSGIVPCHGSLACISYSVSLVTEGGDCKKEFLENCEEFEFEMGNEAVVPHLEVAIGQMVVGQSANFQTGLISEEFILAAAHDFEATLSLLSSRICKLEYTVSLLRVTEPLEDRMEQALFSPPLSKQRVEFAVQHIKESSAACLVDFGCGSGSLLDSILLYPTSLKKVVGVDISLKALARAAKSLHSKLNSLLETKESIVQSAVLYDGSITEFDSRVYGFDIATCLEVIEHMEEEAACLFGDVVLTSFKPKILIVSTPNYEYNVILQKSTQEDDPDEKNNHTQSIKFRNHDHKFEWTRSQFNHWASDLATRHDYDVEFSGVGGRGDVEPGFASQIAIFRTRKDDDVEMNIELAHPYAAIWQWSRENREM